MGPCTTDENDLSDGCLEPSDIRCEPTKCKTSIVMMKNKTSQSNHSKLGDVDSQSGMRPHPTTKILYARPTVLLHI